jgi:hypothetical protein
VDSEAALNPGSCAESRLFSSKEPEFGGKMRWRQVERPPNRSSWRRGYSMVLQPFDSTIGNRRPKRSGYVKEKLPVAPWRVSWKEHLAGMIRICEIRRRSLFLDCWATPPLCPTAVREIRLRSEGILARTRRRLPQRDPQIYLRLKRVPAGGDRAMTGPWRSDHAFSSRTRQIPRVGYRPCCAMCGRLQLTTQSRR